MRRFMTARRDALLRVAIYPIQFNEYPNSNVERVIEYVLPNAGVKAPPEDYVAAIDSALKSTDALSKLIPQPHSEEVSRAYLLQLQLRLMHYSRSWTKH